MPPKRKSDEDVIDEADIIDFDIEEPEIDPEIDPEEEKKEKVKGGDIDEEEESLPAIDSWDNGEVTTTDTLKPRILRFVPQDQRATTERLFKTEFARIVGDRASHLDNGAPTYLADVSKNTSSIEIAYLEVMQRRCPFLIFRHVGNMVEKWQLKEMTIGSVPSLEDMIR
jgi:hypothetical protein